MKKRGILLLLMVIMAAVVMAHPPKSVTVTYKDGKVIIVAVHPVKDPTSHYIDKIKISVDGKVVKELKYTSQTSANELDVTEDLPEVKAGSIIKVKASCNRFGFRNGELKVE